MPLACRQVASASSETKMAADKKHQQVMADKVAAEPLSLSGWMSKKGGVRRNWQKRWFELKGTVLIYTEKEGDAKVSGAIAVDECTAARLSEFTDDKVRDLNAAAGSDRLLGLCGPVALCGQLRARVPLGNGLLAKRPSAKSRPAREWSGGGAGVGRLVSGPRWVSLAFVAGESCQGLRTGAGRRRPHVQVGHC